MGWRFKKNLREAFILFDVNRDGRITETELESVLGFLGVKTTRDEVRRMIRDADCDGDSVALLSVLFICLGF
ncbi:Calmodulin-like protein 5 [Schistosoma japonicum]|nr:Calmodulin-like protein 5 [Schistosoma japonicum]